MNEASANLAPRHVASGGRKSAGDLTGGRQIQSLAGVALVLLATLTVYWPAVHGRMLWDDNFYLTRPDLQSFDGLVRIWFEPSATAQYYPMVHSAFWLEHQLWGDNYLGYHLVNILLHSLSVVLVYLLLVRLKIPGALLAAAIFALHPVMVESVAWMTEQKNALSTVFYLGATWLYLDFDRSQRVAHYLFAIALFVLALLTKTATVTLPVALLIIFWWQRGTLSWRRDIWPLLPFFALSAIAGAVTLLVERSRGAKGPDFAMTFFERFLVAGRDIWFYIEKLLWPANLTFVYPRWKIDSSAWWQWIYPAAAIAMTVVLWLLRGRTRAPLAAWLFFCATLFPVLGFVNVFFFTYSYVADHFQYLASLGLIVLASAGITQAISGLPKTGQYIGFAACLLVVSALGLLTIWQTPMYANSVTLYETTLERNPKCWLAHNNLGLELAEKGDHNGAIEHYQSALRILPNYADAHSNLANEFTRVGRTTDALRELQAALEANNENATYHTNMASTLVQIGRFGEAIAHCREALRLQSNSFDAHYNLGAALVHVGQLPEATAELREALQLRPDDPSALNSLGAAYLQAGFNAEAAEQIERAVELQPNFALAHNNLAQAFARQGKTTLAIEQFRIAVEQNDRLAAAHTGWALVLLAQDKFEEAIGHFEKAIQLGADQPDVRNNLGEAYRKSGKTDKAIEQYQIAVRLNPSYMPAQANLAQTLALVGRAKESVAAAEKAIEVAQATGQQDELGQFEEWLKHYRIELERDANPKSANPTPRTQSQTQSQ